MKKHELHPSAPGSKAAPAKIDIEKLALEFADKYHPGTECVILTGSQTEPDFLSDQSDIDIVLIGSQFHGSSSDGTIDNGHKIDFTIVGYSNIMDMLVDVSYSSPCIVLNMIRTGVILRDETGIGALAKEYCLEAYKKGCRNSTNDAKSIAIWLTKLRKHLMKNLDGRYIPFLAGDFLRWVTAAHILLHQKGWYPYDGFRMVKSVLLRDEKTSFLDDMIRLERDYVEKPHDNIHLILMYVNKYLNLLGREYPAVIDDNRLILNLNFRDQNPGCFYGEICADILDHPYLSKYFTLGHMHDYRHIFKNRYCLVFDTEPEGYEEIRLMKELDDLFWQRRRRVTDMCIVNPAYLLDLCGDAEILKRQESLLSHIVRQIARSVEEEETYNGNKIFLLGVIMSTVILRTFKITDGEIRELLGYLSGKWLAPKSGPEVEAYFRNTYAKNESTYRAIGKQFVERPGLENDDIDLRGVLDRSYSLAEAVAASTVKLPGLCLCSMKMDDTASAEKKSLLWHISNTLEMMLNTIGVEGKDRSYFAYVVKRLYDL